MVVRFSSPRARPVPISLHPFPSTRSACTNKEDKNVLFQLSHNSVSEQINVHKVNTITKNMYSSFIPFRMPANELTITIAVKLTNFDFSCFIFQKIPKNGKWKIPVLWNVNLKLCRSDWH